MPLQSSSLGSCSGRNSLHKRKLITPEQANAIEALFRVLANDTRLRMLHEIARRGEIRVSDLAEALDLKPQAVSNQLQRLHDKGVVASRRSGINIYYRIINDCVTDLLDRGLCLVEGSAD